MKEELRPCKVNIVREVTIGLLGIKEEKEEHNAYFHIWHVEKEHKGEPLSAVVEYEDGTIHFVNPWQITFTDRQNVTVDSKSEKAMIVEGDICEFGKNEKVYVCVTLGRGSMTDDRYVEGFYLTGGNVGHVGSFNLKELRKTDKHINIENFLNQR